MAKVYILVFLLFTVLITANHLYLAEKSFSKSGQIRLPPPRNIKLMTFGYQENFADSLWLSWLQNPEECGKSKISRQAFEESYDGYIAQNKSKVKVSMDFDRDNRDVCSLGWSFLMLDAITELAPKFRFAYLSGTSILSVLVDDHEGAAILYEKALVRFPDDWKLYYGAAYHYLFELDDISRAARYLQKAAQLGGPPWLFSLASKLYSKVGRAFFGISSLKQYRIYLQESGQHEKLREVDERIEKLSRAIKTK